jgi:hypothetical protein
MDGRTDEQTDRWMDGRREREKGRESTKQEQTSLLEIQREKDFKPCASMLSYV